MMIPARAALSQSAGLAAPVRQDDPVRPGPVNGQLNCLTGVELLRQPALS